VYASKCYVPRHDSRREWAAHESVRSHHLLHNDTRFVAYIEDLPYQEGRLLFPIDKGRECNTVLIDYSSSHDEHSPERHIFMATIGDEEVGDQYDNELLDNNSVDELIVNAPQDEDEELRKAPRARHAKCRSPRVKSSHPQPPQCFRGSRRPRVCYSHREHR